jgi:NAD(P)-dependent dehydrogenase (short-subunit alcohol dehydrogenase family)
MHSISIFNNGTMTGFSTNLLKGKRILITGAGKGIGRCCAEVAMACGAEVIAVARTQSDLDDLAAQCGAALIPWAMDVSSDEFLQELSKLYHLHGLLNNAGTNRVGLMTEQSDEDLDAVIELNVRGPWRVSRAAIPAMRRAGGGSIVHMSSQMGHVGSPKRTLYCMSKHAVEGLSKAMAVELAPERIRVNTVAPTFVRTPMTEPMLAQSEFAEFVMGMIPLRQLATQEDVANACIFLLSDLSATTTGSCLKVDGGWTAQ